MVIAFVRGILRTRDLGGNAAEKIVIEVAGVGVELLVSRATAVGLGDIGDEVTVHTSLVIRETEWTMFGFGSADEKEVFGLLQSVTGIGPKMALSLTGTLGPSRVIDAIAAEDEKTLSQAPGVGSKVARRIILELKAKTEDWQLRKGISMAPSGQSSFVRGEAKSILEGLGYTATEISHAFKQLPGENIEDDVELLVRQSLRLLGTADFKR